MLIYFLIKNFLFFFLDIVVVLAGWFVDKWIPYWRTISTLQSNYKRKIETIFSLSLSPFAWRERETKKVLRRRRLFSALIFFLHCSMSIRMSECQHIHIGIVLIDFIKDTGSQEEEERERETSPSMTVAFVLVFFSFSLFLRLFSSE